VSDSKSGVVSTYGYDPSGQVGSIVTSDGQTLSFGFGVDGPLVMSRTWSGLATGSLTYTHDDFFRRGSRAVNGGTPLNVLYDPDGLFAGTSGLAGFSVTRDYEGKNGLVTGTTLGSVSDVYTYNGFGELKTYASSFGATALYTLQIDARDGLGRITGLTETLSGQSHTWGYAYDDHGELASATEDGAMTAFGYDPNGNRLTAGSASSTYDAPDRLLTSAGTTYTYTDNGDLLSEVTASGTEAFAYDLQSSLRSVTLPSGDTVSYVIDGERHRVERTWTHGTQKVVQGFLYDDALRIAAELDASGNVVSTFGYGTKPNVPELMVRGGKTYRIVTDWRGSVRAIVDSQAGAVVQSLDYDAWGNATVSDTSCASGAVCALFQPFGFAGGMFDRETGLVRFGARDYDAGVGRWTQKDPIRFGGGQSNLYVYVNDDPINGIDPSGRISGQCYQSIVAGCEQGCASSVLPGCVSICVAYAVIDEQFGSGGYCGPGYRSPYASCQGETDYFAYSLCCINVCAGDLECEAACEALYVPPAPPPPPPNACN